MKTGMYQLFIVFAVIGVAFFASCNKETIVTVSGKVQKGPYMTINENYLEIIKKCKFISKPDTWFVEGSECVIEDGVIYPEYDEGDKFNAVNGLFNGITMETFKGYSGELPRPDGETCPFDEFFIYDEFGREISELTLKEYLETNN